MVTAGTRMVVLVERVQRAHPNSRLYIYSWICLQLMVDHIALLRLRIVESAKDEGHDKIYQKCCTFKKPLSRLVKADYEYGKLMGE